MKLVRNFSVASIYFFLVFFLVFFLSPDRYSNSFENSLADGKSDIDLALCLHEVRNTFGDSITRLENNRRRNYGWNLPIVSFTEFWSGQIAAGVAASALSWAVEQDHQNFVDTAAEKQVIGEANCHKNADSIQDN